MANVDVRVLEAFRLHGLVLPGDSFESFLDCCLAAVAVLSKEPRASFGTTEERRTYLAGKLADLQFQSVQGVHQLHPRLKAKQHELLLELSQQLHSTPAAATKGRRLTASAASGCENSRPDPKPAGAAAEQSARTDHRSCVASPAATAVQRSGISSATPQLPAPLAFRKSGLIPRTPLQGAGAGDELTSRSDDECDDGVTRRIRGEMPTTELATADLQQLFLVRHARLVKAEVAKALQDARKKQAQHEAKNAVLEHELIQLNQRIASLQAALPVTTNVDIDLTGNTRTLAEATQGYRTLLEKQKKEMEDLLEQQKGLCKLSRGRRQTARKAQPAGKKNQEATGSFTGQQLAQDTLEEESNDDWNDDGDDGTAEVLEPRLQDLLERAERLVARWQAAAEAAETLRRLQAMKLR